MKVLLKKNLDKLGHIGDVVDVRSGYARNYLLPQGLAVTPTPANLKAIEAEKQKYQEELAKRRADIEASAALVNRKEVTITAMANEEGHLYGSVGPQQIAAALAEQSIFVEPDDIVLDAPIRQLDKYDLQVRFAEDISATIHVWIVPARQEDAPDAAPTDQEAHQEPRQEPAEAPDEAPA